VVHGLSTVVPSVVQLSALSSEDRSTTKSPVLRAKSKGVPSDPQSVIPILHHFPRKTPNFSVEGTDVDGKQKATSAPLALR